MKILPTFIFIFIVAYSMAMIAFIVEDNKRERDKAVDKSVEGIIRIIRIEKESAYFEGQKDAIEGDIRIQVNESNRWEWISSPWDGVTNLPIEILPMKDE